MFSQVFQRGNCIDTVQSFPVEIRKLRVKNWLCFEKILKDVKFNPFWSNMVFLLAWPQAWRCEGKIPACIYWKCAFSFVIISKHLEVCLLLKEKKKKKTFSFLMSCCHKKITVSGSSLLKLHSEFKLGIQYSASDTANLLLLLIKGMKFWVCAQHCWAPATGTEIWVRAQNKFSGWWHSPKTPWGSEQMPERPRDALHCMGPCSKLHKLDIFNTKTVLKSDWSE